MKKLISFIVLIALSLSLFSCAKAPVQNDEQPVKDDNLYRPSEFDISDDFRPYEVAVTFTEEESAKGIEYTAKDFPGLDIFLAFEFNEYYSENSYPQLKDNRTYFLMLNKPSKDRVLEYCEKLEQDPRVQFARPNITATLTNRFETTLTPKAFEKIKSYFRTSEYYVMTDTGETIKMDKWEDPYRTEYYTGEIKLFKNMDVDRYYNIVNPEYSHLLYFCITNGDEEHYIQQLKKAVENKNITSIVPHYKFLCDHIISVTTKEGKICTIDDFPEISLEKIEEWEYSTLIEKPKYYLYFKDIDKKELLNNIKLIESKEIVERTDCIYDYNKVIRSRVVA